MDMPLPGTVPDLADPTMLGIAELAPLLKSGALSPVTLMRSCLDRIARFDPGLRSFITVTSERALAQASAAEAEIAAGHYRGPFHGIPYGLKDIVDAKGVVTTAHSRLMPGTPATDDAHVTKLLDAAGGIMLGKLGTFEFALGGPSWDLPWPPPLNPWNTDFLPGGSSSGSGSAVAARFIPAAIGTDTGGSVRWPAACCGIVGLKPTYGLLSRRGVQPNTFSLDHCGPMTRTVRDCALMLAACAGHDPLDPGSADEPIPDYAAALTGDITGLRIGLVRNWYATDATAEVTAATDRAAEMLARLGAIVETIELPDLGDFSDCKTLISMSELYTIHKPDLLTRPELFGAKLRQRRHRRRLYPRRGLSERTTVAQRPGAPAAVGIQPLRCAGHRRLAQHRRSGRSQPFRLHAPRAEHDDAVLAGRRAGRIGADRVRRQRPADRHADRRETLRRGHRAAHRRCL